ncbi:MAG TPA: hypothetical protein VLM75_13035 [Spirochaetota bacterium]|nr:hypothetical protein [Spirochaetota bacterium]
MKEGGGRHCGVVFRLAVVFAVVVLCVPPAAAAEDSAPAKQIERVLSDYASVLSARGWRVFRDDPGALRAYRLHNDYEELRAALSGSSDGEFEIYDARVSYDGAQRERSFRIRKPGPEDSGTDPLRVILPYLIESLGSRGPRRLSAYEASVSAGYNRFHEFEPYPRWRIGTLQLGADLLHDPARHMSERRSNLGFGDYFHFRGHLNLSPEWKDVWYDLILLLAGMQTLAVDDDRPARSVVGLFSGIELSRPSLNFKEFMWSDGIYEDHPHIQYFLLKPVIPGFIHQWGRDRRYRLSAFGSAALSVNSSLCATNISKAEEDALSPIFRSKFYGDRRQNFYYSWSVPLALSFAADRIGPFRIKTEYRFYYFSPVEAERAYDVLNVPGGYIGWYLSRGVLVTAGYEYWNVYSRLRDKTRYYSWHRVFFGLECKIGEDAHSPGNG